VTVDCDVAVVGYGPVGQVLAILLGGRGHRVEVFERWPSLYPLPRAVHFDHEVARILQAAGLGAELPSISEATTAFQLRSAKGEVLAHFGHAGVGPSGWPRSSAFAQPDLEALLDARSRSLPGVSVNRGWEAVELRQVDDGVEIGLRSGSPGPAGDWLAGKGMPRVAARYVIGADGANSFVRSALGVTITDLGFEFDRLVVDLRVEPGIVSADAYTLCDPARPVTVVSGGPGRRRWEFMRMPGESDAEITSEAAVWRLLAPWHVGPDNAVIERSVLYRFRSLWADRWRAGRVMLAGDAAHLMPTYGGQGLCSGLRDAANLAWKLDFVLRGWASEDVLDTYTTERLPHFRQLIDRSIEIARIATVTDPEEAAARDARMLAAQMQSGPPRGGQPPSRIGPGLGFASDAFSGQLFIQGRVESEGRTGLLDDIAGNRFLLIGCGADPFPRLSEASRRVLDGIGGRAIAIDGNFVDVDGTYSAWFAANQRRVVLVRPDFYVYGSSPSIEESDRLVVALRHQLG